MIVSQGPKLRLYPVKVGVGVGRRGRTETYVEIHTGLLRDTDAGYLWMLFSADSLVEGGTLEELLNESKRYAGESGRAPTRTHLRRSRAAPGRSACGGPWVEEADRPRTCPKRTK